jgi:hypothetical protein
VATGLSLPCLLAGCGCPGFAIAMAEFDSVAGWQPAKAEPDVVVYSEDAERLPLALRILEGSGLDIALTGLLGIEPAQTKINSPSSFARERMLCFARDASGDVHRAALATARLTWVLDGDPHPLNQITALHGLHLLAAERALDPLRESIGPIGEQSDEAIVAAWQPHVTALRDAVSALMAGGEPAPAVHAACAQALARVSEQIPPAPRDRRAQTLLLNYLAHRAPSREVRLAATSALDLAMRRLAADSLRRALYEPRSPMVRDAAVRTCCALGDEAAVARILRLVTTPEPPGGSGTSDLDPTVRLTLVRLCGQLPTTWAQRAEPGGPAPVEFLYDVIADANTDRSLQVAALEALATCLGRPASVERRWADEWWADYVVNRGGRV